MDTITPLAEIRAYCDRNPVEGGRTITFTPRPPLTPAELAARSRAYKTAKPHRPAPESAREGMMPRVATFDHDEAVRLHAQGATVYELARRYDVGETHIRTVIRKASPHHVQADDTLSIAERADLARMPFPKGTVFHRDGTVVPSEIVATFPNGDEARAITLDGMRKDSLRFSGLQHLQPADIVAPALPLDDLERLADAVEGLSDQGPKDNRVPGESPDDDVATDDEIADRVAAIDLDLVTAGVATDSPLHAAAARASGGRTIAPQPPLVRIEDVPSRIKNAPMPEGGGFVDLGVVDLEAIRPAYDLYHADDAFRAMLSILLDKLRAADDVATIGYLVGLIADHAAELPASDS